MTQFEINKQELQALEECIRGECYSSCALDIDTLISAEDADSMDDESRLSVEWFESLW